MDITATDISTTIAIGTQSTNVPSNTNTPSVNILQNNTSNNNNSTTNIINNVNNTNNTSNNTNVNDNTPPVSQYVNNTNQTPSEDIPKTGVEDTIMNMIFVLLVVAFACYIKFEKVNKEMK